MHKNTSVSFEPEQQPGKLLNPGKSDFVPNGLGTCLSHSFPHPPGHHVPGASIPQQGLPRAGDWPQVGVGEPGWVRLGTQSTRRQSRICPVTPEPREEAGRKHPMEVSSSQTQGKRHLPRSSREGTQGEGPCTSTLGVHKRESSSVCGRRRPAGDMGEEMGKVSVCREFCKGCFHLLVLQALRCRLS